MEFSSLDSFKLLENLHAGVVVHDANTKIRYANPRALELLRLTEEQALNKGAFDPEWHFIDKNKRIMLVADYPVNQVIASQQALTNIEVGICDSTTDDVTWVLCNAYPEFSKTGEISQVVVTFIDISEQRKTISFDSIVELASDVIVVTEALPILGQGPKICYVNQAFTKLTGYTKEEVIGKTPRILQGEDTNPITKNKLRKALEKQLAVEAQILNYSKSGREYWLDLHIFPLKNHLGDVTHFVAIERDVTEQKNYEEALKQLSIRDPLTSLLNRRGFFEMAQAQLSQGKRNQQEMAITMIDIDYFKKINDEYGHDIGDLALKHISNLMLKFFRESDNIGRLGGEEFAILLVNSNKDDSIAKLNQFRQYLAENALEIECGEAVSFTISAGITYFTSPDQTISDLIKQADLALYEAKSLGRNQVCCAHRKPI